MAGAYWQEVMADNPVAYWRFEEDAAAMTVASEVGGHTGTVVKNTAAPSIGVYPKLGEPGATPAGEATDIGGGAGAGRGYIDCPDSSAILGSNPQTWTVEAWLWHPNTTNALVAVTDYDGGGGGDTHFGFLMGITAANKAWMLLRNAGTDFQAVSTTSIGLATPDWFHVVGVVDITSAVAASRTVKVYVNGVLETTTTNVNQVDYIDAAAAVLIGTQWNTGGTNATWGGKIDEVALYTTALSDARILAHYRARNNAEFREGWGVLI